MDADPALSSSYRSRFRRDDEWIGGIGQLPLSQQFRDSLRPEYHDALRGNCSISKTSMFSEDNQLLENSVLVLVHVRRRYSPEGLVTSGLPGGVEDIRNATATFRGNDVAEAPCRRRAHSFWTASRSSSDGSAKPAEVISWFAQVDQLVHHFCHRVLGHPKDGKDRSASNSAPLGRQRGLRILRARARNQPCLPFPGSTQPDLTS